jgi:hypothetical protein
LKNAVFEARDGELIIASPSQVVIRITKEDGKEAIILYSNLLPYPVYLKSSVKEIGKIMGVALT